MISRTTTIISFLAILLLGGGFWWWWSSPPAQSLQTSPTLATYLSAEAEDGFAQAIEPNNVTFPRDFGPHDDYQTEWWYYTGNLETADGRQFGYQFTIFRRALAPPTNTAVAPENRSNWRSNQVYFAHFALSDIAENRFYNFDKFTRGAAGLAGATAEPYQVWIEDWSVIEQADGSVDMTAVIDDVALHLNLNQTQPPILHGEGGLSQKGTTAGSASYYYSQIKQTSVGTITLGDQTFSVTGDSWKDHEYSTNALDSTAIGWDWFSLSLDDEAGHALMLFNIRNGDGSIQTSSGGSWITATSDVEKLRSEQVKIEVLDSWRSPRTGATYPAAWRITIPHLELELVGRPLMADQELNLAQIYWEGAVSFTGTLKDEAVTAVGYIELTGYE